jgi:predicted RecA/RadA family phage recombinase
MKRIRTLALVSALAGALVVGGGVAVAQTSASAGPAQASVASSVIIPPQLAVPAGQRLIASMEVARGSQVYTCTNGTFTLLEPAAVLRNGKELVLHTRGPEWVSANDGSAVAGSVVASAPRPNAVPELLLKSTSNRGTGIFGNVDYIQRLETVGGVAPAGTCRAGSQVAVAYHAQYRFYVPAEQRNS